MEDNHGFPARAWSAVADAWDDNVDDRRRAFGRQHRRTPPPGWPFGPGGPRASSLAAGPGESRRHLVEARGPARCGGRERRPAGGMVEKGASAGKPADENGQRPRSSTGPAIDRPTFRSTWWPAAVGLMFSAGSPRSRWPEIPRWLDAGWTVSPRSTWGRHRNTTPWMTCVGMAAMANGIVKRRPPMSVPAASARSAIRTKARAVGQGARDSSMSLSRSNRGSVPSLQASTGTSTASARWPVRLASPFAGRGSSDQRAAFAARLPTSRAVRHRRRAWKIPRATALLVAGIL